MGCKANDFEHLPHVSHMAMSKSGQQERGRPQSHHHRTGGTACLFKLNDKNVDTLVIFVLILVEIARKI